MGVAYFVRGYGERWAVIRLYPDDREEIVADGLSILEAEILAAMKIEDLPREAPSEEPAVEESSLRRRRSRQMSLKF